MEFGCWPLFVASICEKIINNTELTVVKENKSRRISQRDVALSRPMLCHRRSLPKFMSFSMFAFTIDWESEQVTIMFSFLLPEYSMRVCE